VITDPLFYLAAIPAVMIMGLAKGGFAGISILSVPLLALVVSPVQAASITLPILIVQDVVSVWVFRRAWDGRSLVILLPSALFGIILGYLLAAYVSAAAVELVIGVISIVFGARWLWIHWSGVVRPHGSSDVAGLAWGTVSGFTSQIAHAGGVPFQLYMLPKRLERDVLIGTSSLYFAAVNWMKVPAYMALGQFTRANMATSAALFPLAVIATIVGAKVIRRISSDRVYVIFYILLVLVGLKLTWDGAEALPIGRTS
jgi:uncharacterized membrane protein YfcA